MKELPSEVLRRIAISIAATAELTSPKLGKPVIEVSTIMLAGAAIALIQEHELDIDKGRHLADAIFRFAEELDPKAVEQFLASGNN